MILMIASLLFGTPALASNVSCEPLYRAAYVQAVRDQSPSEAASIYLIHFDYQNGVQEAFNEAEPLFRILGVDAALKPAVLEALSAKMESGELCPLGRVMGFGETALRLSR